MLGLDFSKEQLSLFEHYAIELTTWNKKINLTAIIDPLDILIKHFLDSLSCILAIQMEDHSAKPLRLIDIGTGAGFPAIPLKIAYPQMKVTLVDSVGKKCAFLRYIVNELGLEGVEVLHDRVETLGSDPHHRTSYDWAIARAVAWMPVLCEYLLPLVPVGGYCIAQKREDAIVETREAARVLDVLGGQVRRLLPVDLPGVAAKRYLVVLRKVAATPEKYPRRPGMPSKHPLV
jgi:16S rRNA (guanine527-N7)-methyltransferase